MKRKPSAEERKAKQVRKQQEARERLQQLIDSRNIIALADIAEHGNVHHRNLLTENHLFVEPLSWPDDTKAAYEAELERRRAAYKEASRQEDERRYQEIQAEEKRRKKEWTAYLEKHGLADDKTARMLANVLKNPPDIEWLITAIAAVETNIMLNGQCARTAAQDGWDYELIRAAIIAHKRHENTDYDDLLEKGIDRESARIMKTEK